MTRHSAADAIVVGGGLVGLACASAMADRQISVLVLSDRRPGEASPAAAGMLAPSVEQAGAVVHRFGVAARDRYPSFLDALAEATGERVSLLRNGIIELALEERVADAHRGGRPWGSAWIEPAELASLEPALAPAAGAVFHPHDGAVDNVALLAALERRVAAHSRARVMHERVAEIALGTGDAGQPTVRAESGDRRSAALIVLAAGCWAGTLPGVPRRLPVAPLRGQMLSYDTRPLGHVTYGPRGYVVPRGRATLAGSTMENVGFEVGTTSEGQAAIADAASEICPAFARAPVRARWSGLRPVTPDLLPILGRDPAQPSLVYACGHSRNGVLLAPLTGDCVAALAAGEEPGHDLTPFGVERFAT